MAKYAPRREYKDRRNLRTAKKAAAPHGAATGKDMIEIPTKSESDA